MRTIDWDDGAVCIIDQTLLPQECTTLVIRSVDDLVTQIQRLAVRGAMALGVAGALGVALAASQASKGGSDVSAAVESAAAKLRAARPTAVNLSWGVNTVVATHTSGGDIADIVAAAVDVLEQDVRANRELSRRGAELLSGKRRILTHCNTGALAGVECGTALGVIDAINADRPLDLVLVCETRPLLQGSRLTAWELGRSGIPHRVIVDSAAAGLILSGEVDAVVVGADRITTDGDVINKVGTVGHALAAARAGIPFLVAAPESTIDPGTAAGADVPIERRDELEVLEIAGTRMAPTTSRGLNPAFDVTPADLVTAIVTESRAITEWPIPTLDPSAHRSSDAGPAQHPRSTS